ncbi:MAG: thermonuclease family protein [Kiritimatiellae bacterium]|nr:thermonuclease family protein [Kiritimatiellia bacterium]
MSFTSLRVIVFALLFSALSILPSSAATPWSVLEGCTLLDNAYNDGDSFHVRHDGKEYIFRLYFVDAPEDDDSFPQRVDEQAQYFGIAREEALSTGLAARDFVRTQLAQPFTVITRWHSAQGRSRTPRFYAFVRPPDKDLAVELISRGYARVYGVRTSTPEGEISTRYRARLLSVEDGARLAGLGAWQYSKPVEPAKTANGKATHLRVVAPRTVAVYSDDLPRRRLGEIARGTHVTVVEEFEDGWVRVEYLAPDGAAQSGICLRWDISLPDYAPDHD